MLGSSFSFFFDLLLVSLVLIFFLMKDGKEEMKKMRKKEKRNEVEIPLLVLAFWTAMKKFDSPVARNWY